MISICLRKKTSAKSLLVIIFLLSLSNLQAQTLQFTVSFPAPNSHQFHVDLEATGWNTDSNGP
jgi:hypothetical protein